MDEIFTGRIKSNSNVLLFRSSEKDRIVRAGIKKRKRKAEMVKKEDIDAYPLSRILKFPENPQRKHPTTRRYAKEKKAPDKEQNTDFSSRINNTLIYLCYYSILNP